MATLGAGPAPCDHRRAGRQQEDQLLIDAAEKKRHRREASSKEGTLFEVGRKKRWTTETSGFYSSCS